LQALACRDVIFHSRLFNWKCGQVGIDEELEKGWPLGLADWITSYPAAFREYGYLAENGRHSTPSRNTAVLSFSRQL